MAALLVIGLFLLIFDYRVSVTEIETGLKRNSYGEGTRNEELEVSVNGNERKSIEIEVSEQKYQEEEAELLFTKCISRIEQEVLGENKSLDYVTTNLNLMTTLEGMPVEISWRLDNYDVMNIYGEIQKEAVVETGTLVSLEAVITYTENQELQALHSCLAMIYPEELSQEDKILQKITSKIETDNIEKQTDEMLELPEVIDGKSLRYFRKMEDRGGILIIMAVLIGILFYAQEMQNQGMEIKKKKQQMMIDYPEIINKLTLFLEAGMTLKRSFGKVVKDYEEEKEIWGIRFAYEEMKVACREMESGISEAESYERFGRRCDIPEYVRLGAVLSQNMRKGTKGLSNVLRLEAIQAFENRKAAAKRLGEEAGTKLLLPMFIMLAVVLVIVVIPAFLTLQI